MTGFNYCVRENFLGAGARAEISAVVSAADGWVLHDEGFFSQYDNVLAETHSAIPLPAPFRLLYEEGRRWLGKELAVVVGNRFNVTAHRLQPGQFIGCHNDSPSFDRGRRENYRLIYFLDDEYNDEKGGYLLLHDSGHRKSVIEGFRPIADTAVLMELSDFSYHSVTTVNAGTRESVVVSFWGFPLLQDVCEHDFRASACLRLLLDAGFENENHSGTTFLDHLYGVFRILKCCGADAELCLAGLLHAVLGRKYSGISPSRIRAGDIAQICGGEVLRLVQAFASYRGPGRTSGNLSSKLTLIDIANALEQVDSLPQVREVENILARCYSLSAQAREVIATELSLRRDALTREKMSHSE